MKKTIYRRRFSVNELLLVHQKVVGQRDALLHFSKRILQELPTKRDWLDPELEAFGKAAIKKCQE